MLLCTADACALPRSQPRPTTAHKARQTANHDPRASIYKPRTSIAAKGTLVKWYICRDADRATSSSCPPRAHAAAPAPAAWAGETAANLMQLKARGVLLSGSPSSLLRDKRNQRPKEMEEESKGEGEGLQEFARAVSNERRYCSGDTKGGREEM